MKERWREIYDGHYKISNKGRLKRNKPGSGTYVGRILKPKYRTEDNMYPYYILSINNRQLTKEIHKLVSEVFIGLCPKGYEVNHIDGNKENPYVDNLEYVTHLENSRHASKNGLLSRVSRGAGEKNNKAKLNKHKVRLIRFMGKTKLFTHREIADMFEVSRNNTTGIINYKTWKHI